jgi:hypothetical protein
MTELRKPTIRMKDLSVNYMAILRTQSETFKTDDMMLEIMSQLDMIPGVKYKQDVYGNMYAWKGKASKDETYPIFVCHTDTVHPIKESYQVIRSKQGHYFAVTEEKGDPAITGIGGDDKCGIIACIELLWKLKRVKCAFFLDEERGCKGSAAGDLEFFNDGRFAIQVDRKGNGDIITTGSGTELCSDDFKKLLNGLGEVYNYKSTTGASTDVVKLKERGLKISSVNLSCGYYNPHCKTEFIDERDFLNCLEFCIAISRFKTVFPHEYKPKTYTNYNTTPYSGGYGKNYGTGYYAKNYASKESNTITHIPRQCLSCNKILIMDEAKVCLSCLQGNMKRLILHVNSDNEKILVASNKPILPEECDRFLPSVRCLVCDENDLRADQEVDGYCDSCTICRLCHIAMTSGEEVLRGVHDECPAPDKKVFQRVLDEWEPSKADEYCKCGNWFKDDLEKMEKICRICRATSYLGGA